ncbi:MAG: TonB-dependent receptor [Pseudomonadota bacterium]
MKNITKTAFGLKAGLSLSVGLTALVAGSGLTAAAQDEGEDNAKRLGTVTITATKREQTLQDVPVAVSVVDNTTIEQAQIVDIIDLQSVVPSLRVGQFQQSGNASFSIRGFGNGANNVGIEPAVAVFIDGVYRTRAAGGLSDYSDIERIEVLRGPQSTLFGKNASVGLINVVTQKPEFEFGGNVEATVGNYNSTILKGQFTGPISDKLAFAVSGSVNQRDGYAENIALGTDLNDRDRFALKGQLLFEPNDDLSVRLIADFDKLDETCCYSPNIISGPTEPAIVAAGGQVITDPFGFETALDVDPTNEITNRGISAQADWDIGPGTLTSITAFRSQELLSDGDVDFTSLAAIQENLLDLDIDTFTQEFRYSGETESFDYLVGAFYFDETVDQRSNVLYDTAFYDYGNFLAGGALPGIEALLGFAPRTFFEAGTGSRETFNQENESYSIFAQGDWHINDRLTATFGVSYINDEKTVTAAAVNDDLFSSLDLATSFNNTFVADQLLQATQGVTLADAIGAAAYEAVTMTAFDAADFVALQTAAAGGDATAIATLTAIGGLSADPGFQGAVQAGAASAIAAAFQPLQFLPPFLDFPNAVEGNSTSDDQFTYTARLAYDVMDNLNVYASYATGFKASSWNITRDSSYFASDEAALATAGLIPNNRTAGTRFAGPEDTTVYELGAKFSSSNFNLNMAIFDQTVEGFQSTIFQGTGFVLANAGEQSTQGIEWDATWLATDNLTLTFAGIVQDPVYDSFVNAPVAEGSEIDLADGVQDGSGDISGSQPAGIPETSLSFGGVYEQDLWDGVSGFLRADYQYESEVQVVDNIPGVDREIGLLNASLGLRWDNGLDVTVWGRNLNDDEYFQSAFPGVAQEGSVNGYPNAPKTYGVTVRKTF